MIVCSVFQWESDFRKLLNTEKEGRGWGRGVGARGTGFHNIYYH